MTGAFEKAWGLVRSRDALFEDELKLPGADAFVGPKMGNVRHALKNDLPYDEYDDPLMGSEPYEEALAHAQDKERNKILAEGIRDPRRPSCRGPRCGRPVVNDVGRYCDQRCADRHANELAEEKASAWERLYGKFNPFKKASAARDSVKDVEAVVCDECLMALSDEGLFQSDDDPFGEADYDVEHLARELGHMISDHRCEEIDEAEIKELQFYWDRHKCVCSCHR